MPGAVAKFPPKKIKDYLTTNFSDSLPVKYEFDDRRHKVTFQDGLELEFDKDFKLIEVDN